MRKAIALVQPVARPMHRTRIYIPMLPLVALAWLLMPLILVIIAAVSARRGLPPARIVGATAELFAGLAGLRVHIETPDADIRLG
jgi:hypothetical protein